MDLLTDLSQVQVGEQLTRLSLLTVIPVVVSAIEGDVVSVTLRPEDHEENVQHITLGMMLHRVEDMSPVVMLRKIVWKYDMHTGIEIDPAPGLASMLLK